MVIERGRERVGLGSWRRYIVTTCILPKDFERVRRYKGVTCRYRDVTLLQVEKAPEAIEN